MTARPLRAPQQGGRIRVIGGRKRLRRPSISPFFVFGVVIVASMIGIVVARTSLDSGAFRLAELEERIQQEERRQEVLVLEVARLESPTRIGPLAEEMGMVPAEDRTVLVIEGERATDPGAYDGSQMAMAEAGDGTGGTDD
jgi:cell division protein FtsL